MPDTTHDFFASHLFETHDQLEAQIIRNRAMDLWTKTRLLPLARTAAAGLKEDVRALYQQIVHGEGDTLFKKYIIAPNRSLMEQLGIYRCEPDELSLLPTGSALLSFDFTLKKAYISRDDAFFHVLDNPVRKETVFKLPMISAASWKGNLRWMAGYLRLESWKEASNRSEESGKHSPLEWEKDRARLYLLFGPENEAADRYFNCEIAKLVREANEAVADSFQRFLQKKGLPHGKEQGFQGRLFFFPTYFDQMDMEVINPHNRETGAGEMPIYIESVPAGTKGRFFLLYVPADLMNQPCRSGFEREVGKDLSIIVEALTSLMVDFGFSAKKSSGYGVVEEELTNGRLLVRGMNLPDTQNVPDMFDNSFATFRELEQLVNSLRGRS